jgi:hypothetical protein
VSEWMRAGELNESDVRSDAATKHLEHDRVAIAWTCYIHIVTLFGIRRHANLRKKRTRVPWRTPLHSGRKWGRLQYEYGSCM